MSAPGLINANHNSTSMLATGGNAGIIHINLRKTNSEDVAAMVKPVWKYQVRCTNLRYMRILLLRIRTNRQGPYGGQGKEEGKRPDEHRHPDATF